MLDRSETDEQRARIAAVEAQRVAVREVLGWFAPWALGAALVLVCLGALWCASTATDNLTYAIGLIGALLALIALLWEMSAAQSGRIRDISFEWLVDDVESLIVLMAILAVIALGGLILAARGPSATASGVGYGLCIFGVVLAFANLKYYFDRLER